MSEYRELLSEFVKQRGLEGHPAIPFLGEFVDVLERFENRSIVDLTSAIEKAIGRAQSRQAEYLKLEGKGGLGYAVIEAAIRNGMDSMRGRDRRELEAALSALKSCE